MAEAYDKFRAFIQASIGRRKIKHEFAQKFPTFEVDDIVLYWCPRKRTGLSPKWQNLWTGLHKIIAVIPPACFRIKDGKTGSQVIMNANKLAHYKIWPEEKDSLFNPESKKGAKTNPLAPDLKASPSPLPRYRRPLRKTAAPQRFGQ